MLAILHYLRMFQKCSRLNVTNFLRMFQKLVMINLPNCLRNALEHCHARRVKLFDNVSETSLDKVTILMENVSGEMPR